MPYFERLTQDWLEQLGNRVLAGDFMKVPADQLSELGIDYVFIGSKLVYENQGEADLSQDDRDGM